MSKKVWVALISLFAFFSLISSAVAETPAPQDEKKHTQPGKYVTAQEAYEMWKSGPEKVKILDCRTPQEYVYVGHAPMAYNIPSKLWTGKWNEEKKEFALEDNPDFEARAKKIFKTDDTILVMCRSGHRSAESVNRLAEAGFTNAYNIVDGFEGDKIKDEESYYNGKRMKNGWRNSGAPWTYDLDPGLIHAPESK